jgi:hypothetical protein
MGRKPRTWDTANLPRVQTKAILGPPWPGRPTVEEVGHMLMAAALAHSRLVLVVVALGHRRPTVEVPPGRNHRPKTAHLARSRRHPRPVRLGRSRLQMAGERHVVHQWVSEACT